VGDRSETFHVPNTDISIIFYPHRDFPMDLSLLRRVIWDSLTEVSLIIEHGGDGNLPPGEDPYRFTKYVGTMQNGAFIVMRSPTSEPGLGRKLTWGNVKNVLLRIRDFIIKGKRGYAVNFTVTRDLVGDIGWGGLLQGSPVWSADLVGKVGDAE